MQIMLHCRICPAADLGAGSTKIINAMGEAKHYYGPGWHELTFNSIRFIN